MKQFFICILLPLFVYANNSGSLSGTIRSSSDVLAGANIIVMNSNQGTSSDVNGNYFIDNLTPGRYSLSVAFIGYKTQIVPDVEIKKDGITRLDVELRQELMQLDQIVVTGTLFEHHLKDTPVITEVLSNEEIAEIGSQNLVDVMKEQTGLDISYGVGRTQSAQLHGLSDNHVLVLIDGERITGKVDGALDLGQIPVEQIERIEMVKGPVSSVYGSDALGGVINIITKEPTDARAVNASITAGSNGRQDYTFSAARTFGDVNREEPHYSFSGSGSWNKYFGIDYDETDNFMELPEYDRKNFSLIGKGQFNNKFKADIRANYYRDRMEWMSGNPANIFLDVTENDKLSITGTGQYTFQPGTSLKLVVNQSANKHTLNETSGSGALIVHNVTDEVLSDYRLQYSTTPYSSSVFSMGYEYLAESVNSDRIIGQQKEYRSNIIFAESEWLIAPITLTLGGRYSDNSVYGSFFSPKFSAMYKPLADLKFRFSYGKGFREPSIKELFIDYSSSVGYHVIGEPGLKPEKSDGYNLGVEYSGLEDLWFRANFYYNNVRNLIDYYTADSRGERVILSYYNVNSAITKGLDIDMDYDLSQNIHVKLGYNYTVAEDASGRTLPFRIPNTVNFKISGEIPDWGLKSNLRGHWYDKKPVLDDQTNKNIYSGSDQSQLFYVNSYLVLDFNLRKQLFHDFELITGVSNLTDKTYYPFGQIKGREFYAGIEYSLQ